MSKKNNILLVANWESNVGYAWWLMENFWITISKHFGDLGCRCILIYPKITAIPKSIDSSDALVLECNFRDRSMRNLSTLRKLIKSESIRFIYLSDSPAYSWFYLLLRVWGIKKIVVHDHTPGERTTPKPIKRQLKFLIQRIPLYTADHFIAVTKYVHERLVNISCIPENKCSIAQNGIHPIELSKKKPYYTHFAFNIPKNRRIIITTGRATYYKGIDFFIKCANELINNRSHNDLHFLFCGDGPDIDDFKRLCKDLNVTEYFTFSGKRSDIVDMLPSCDIGMQPSLGEVGYSLSILEYMSAGLVTVVPDGPSTCRATRHMEDGIIYKKLDIASACDAIETGLNNDLRKKLSTNAIKSVRQNFNIENTNKQLASILRMNFTADT